MELYEATCQRDMSSFPGLKDAMLQVQGHVVECAAERCRNCGVDPRA